MVTAPSIILQELGCLFQVEFELAFPLTHQLVCFGVPIFLFLYGHQASFGCFFLH
jgi:hypothetical protein